MVRMSSLRIPFMTCLSISLFFARTTAPQTGPKMASLCAVQKEVADGEHETVRVSGVYGPGLDHTVLQDSSCSNEGTWVELDLRSKRNEQKLHRMLNDSRQAYVVVEGEFYGAPLPDPKLPEAIRKEYHPGWGHLGAFKTKLVVHVILDVKSVPAHRTRRVADPPALASRLVEAARGIGCPIVSGVQETVGPLPKS